VSFLRLSECNGINEMFVKWIQRWPRPGPISWKFIVLEMYSDSDVDFYFQMWMSVQRKPTTVTNLTEFVPIQLDHSAAAVSLVTVEMESPARVGESVFRLVAEHSYKCICIYTNAKGTVLCIHKAVLEYSSCNLGRA
jgi:aspartokinase